MAIISLINRKGGGQVRQSREFGGWFGNARGAEACCRLRVMLIDMDDQLSATITANGRFGRNSSARIIAAQFCPGFAEGSIASESLIIDSLIPRNRQEKVKTFLTNKSSMEGLEAL